MNYMIAGETALAADIFAGLNTELAVDIIGILSTNTSDPRTSSSNLVTQMLVNHVSAAKDLVDAVFSEYPGQYQTFISQMNEDAISLLEGAGAGSDLASEDATSIQDTTATDDATSADASDSGTPEAAATMDDATSADASDPGTPETIDGTPGDQDVTGMDPFADPEAAATMAAMTPEAMQGMDAGMMAAMTPEAMQGMDADMMDAMMAGMPEEQIGPMLANIASAAFATDPIQGIVTMQEMMENYAVHAETIQKHVCKHRC